MPGLKSYHKLAIGRLVGMAASVVLLVSIFFPYVESASLATLTEPILPGMFQVFASPTFQNFAIMTSSVGFLLVISGGIIGLVSFAVLSKSRAGIGMDVAILGILLVSAPVLEFQGPTISRVSTVTGAVYWPTLKFFAVGYFISWAAAIIGLAATHAGRIERVGVAQQHAVLSAQPVISREILTSQQAKGIKQVEKGRLPTGYDALDSVLLGGIPEGSNVVLTGVGSDERDLVVRRFIETTLSSGRGCIYLSTSIERIRDLLQQHEKEMQVILCNPQAEVIASEFANVRKLKSSLEDLTAVNLEFEASKNTLAALQTKGPPSVCFEILGDTLLRHHAANTRKWLMDILARAKSGKMTALATFNPRMHPTEEAHTIEELFDGHIELQEEDVLTRGAKMIRVRKLGGQRFIEKDLLVEKEHI